jgi:hypothetical protein
MMTSTQKGYIFYTPSEKTRVFIYKMFLSENCKIIYEQSSPHDLDTLHNCICDLTHGDTLILWRIDKSIPKYHNKLSWITNILKQKVRIISLADRLTIDFSPEHPSSRFLYYLKNKSLDVRL